MKRIDHNWNDYGLFHYEDVESLHDLKIATDMGPIPQSDYSAKADGVEVVFAEHEERLVRLIAEARGQGLLCYGAVAWLTNLRILEALSAVPCRMLVQKEDFLRPDVGQRAGGAWERLLRLVYEKLEHEGPDVLNGRDTDLWLQ